MGGFLVSRMVCLSRIDEALGAAFVCVLLFILVETADGNVILIGRNLSRSFDDIEANFGKSFFFLYFLNFSANLSLFC